MCYHAIVSEGAGNRPRTIKKFMPEVTDVPEITNPPEETE